MSKTQEFIDSMGTEWWDELEYSERVEYHGKLTAEMWDDDWKIFIDSVVENSDLDRREALLFLSLLRLDRMQDIQSRVHGWYSQGKPGPGRTP